MTCPTSFDDWHNEPDRFRDQLRQLLRYRATIAAGIALGLLGALSLTLLRGPCYTATGEVLVRSTTDPFSPFGVSVDNQVSMGTEREIALSAAVATRAAEALHERPSRATVPAGDLSVSYAPNAQVLTFAFTAGDPRRAARVTNALLQAYLADRQARTEGTVRRTAQGLKRQLAPLLVPRKKDDPRDPGSTDLISTLQKRISDIESRDTTGGDIVRKATPPSRPSGPGRATLFGFGMLGGLVLGVVFAWLRSALEPRARSIAEVQGALGAPVLGILAGAGRRGELLHLGRSDGGPAQLFRTLAFRVRHGGGRTPGGSLLIVAPKRDAMAEAAAVNLAAAFAEYGDDVLLIDATASTPGLAARLPLVTAGGDDTEPAGLPEGGVVVDAGTAGRFTLAPGTSQSAGDAPASPTVTRLLSCAGTAQSALVVCRPLLEHTDALAVAQRVDGVLVLAGLDRTRRDDLRRVRELIGLSGGHVLGAVVTAGSGGRAGRGILRRAPKPLSAPVAPDMPAQAQPGSSAPDATVAASQG